MSQMYKNTNFSAVPAKKNLSGNRIRKSTHEHLWLRGYEIDGLVDPCPVVFIGNLMQCLYVVADILVDIFSLNNSASSKVCAWMEIISLWMPYFLPAKLATEHSILLQHDVALLSEYSSARYMRDIQLCPWSVRRKPLIYIYVLVKVMLLITLCTK